MFFFIGFINLIVMNIYDNFNVFKCVSWCGLFGVFFIMFYSKENEV